MIRQSAHSHYEERRALISLVKNQSQERKVVYGTLLIG